MQQLSRLSGLGSLGLLALCSAQLWGCGSSEAPDGEEGTGGAGVGGSATGGASLGGDDGPGSGGALASTGGAGTGGMATGGASSGGAGPEVHPAVAARTRVLQFFSDISGQRTLPGIENKSSTSPHGHTDEVAGLAGKTPSFWGADFGFGSGAVNNRATVIAEAKKQWNDGAVVSLMYHTCVPTRDEYCDWDDIGGAHPVHLNEQQWADLFTPGTSIYVEWHRRLDILAGYFQELRDAGVAPLFRPFHEMNQCAFWWSCKTGTNGTVRLWKETRDYLVNVKGQDHLVWTWNIQDFTSLGSDAVTYNPGADYFDLATLDIYNTGYTMGNYDTMLSAAGGKPIGIGECQFLPSVSLLQAQPQWTFFMLWPDFIHESKNTPLYQGLFASTEVQTLDEMPGWD